MIKIALLLVLLVPLMVLSTIAETKKDRLPEGGPK